MKKTIKTSILMIVLILTLTPIVLAEKEIDVIIKLKDNNEKNLFMTKKEQVLSKTKIIESQIKFAEKIGKDKIRIKQTLTTQNIFSATVDLETYEALKKNPEIEYIDENIKLKINLVESTELINATRAWEHQVNGINITGEGTSVCIIDTGIDYTHEAFGSCTNLSLQAIGDEEELITESIHPYESNYTNITTITMPGYSSIAVHFKNISVENGYDYIQILDENNNVIQTYTGFHQNIWTPHVEGDTIKIKIITGSSVIDYGYYSDKVLNGTTNRTCEKIPTGYDFVNNDDDPYDDEGHGTHVAGIVAADGSIKGVAPKAKLIIAKAMNENGSGDALVVASAIEWCTLNKEAYNITAISMSLGSADYNNTYCDQRLHLITYLINQAVLKNISVVIATGNENQSSQISFPSCITNATRVTATSKTDTFPSFANRGGLFNDILTAPGVNINSATIGGGWGLNSGTSMSTPHVSGGIALIKQYLELSNKAKTPKQIETILNNTGKNLFDSESGKNYTRIDVYKAIDYLTKTSVITSYEPESTNIIIRKNNSLIFNHTSWDEFNRTLYYYWYINEELESQEQNFTLNSTELETGNYNLTLIVSNNETNISTSWNITIAPPKIDVEFNYSNNITNFEWTQGTNKNNALNLSNHFITDPYENIEYTLINSTKINMTITNNIISFLVNDNNYYGEQIVLIKANDSNSSAQSNEFTIKINEKIEETPRTSGGGSSGGGGGGLPPIDTSKYSEIIIEADKEIKISNNNDKVPFKELQIKINKKIENARIIVEALKENPFETNNLQQKIYKTISITHTNLEDEDIDEAIIKFSVERNWTINNSVEKEKIKLLRYTNKWTELETKYLSFDANNYYYESISPGLSLFAITVEEEQTQEEPKPEFYKNESTIELFIVEKNETLIEQKQPQTIQESKQTNKMNELTIKIISAILSIIAILLVIILINELAKKRAKKMLKQKKEELKILEKQDNKHK